jgi:hypothetical protein
MTLENHFNITPLNELASEIRALNKAGYKTIANANLLNKINSLKDKYSNIYKQWYVVSDGSFFYNYFICLGDPLLTKCQTESKAIVYTFEQAEGLLKYLNKRKRRVKGTYKILAYNNNLNND